MYFSDVVLNCPELKRLSYLSVIIILTSPFQHLKFSAAFCVEAPVKLHRAVENSKIPNVITLIYITTPCMIAIAILQQNEKQKH